MPHPINLCFLSAIFLAVTLANNDPTSPLGIAPYFHFLFPLFYHCGFWIFFFQNAFLSARQHWSSVENINCFMSSLFFFSFERSCLFQTLLASTLFPFVYTSNYFHLPYGSRRLAMFSCHVQSRNMLN